MTKLQNFKPGFKTSPLGLIPCDWKVSKIHKISITIAGIGGQELNFLF